MADREAGEGDDAVEVRQRIWSTGDYPALARHLRRISLEVLDVLDLPPGTRLLDVGVGDGNTGIEAAVRGAAVTGVDLTPTQIERARARAAAEGAAIALVVGDAEDLPCEGAAFDVVVSVLGAMFAPHHERMATELVRVCRPGGTVAFVAWAAGGWFEQWRHHAARVLPGSGADRGPADPWGDPAEATRRLRGAGLDVTVEVCPFHWSLPSTRAAVELFLGSAGAFIAFREAATAAGVGDQVEPALQAALDEANLARDGTCRLAAPYLLALGRRPS